MNSVKKSGQVCKPFISSNIETPGGVELLMGRNLENIGQLVSAGLLSYRNAALKEFAGVLRIAARDSWPGYPSRRGANRILGLSWLVWRFHDRKTETFTGSMAKLANIAAKRGAVASKRSYVRAWADLKALPISPIIRYRSTKLREKNAGGNTPYAGSESRYIFANQRRDLIAFGGLMLLEKEAQADKPAVFSGDTSTGLSKMMTLKKVIGFRNSWRAGGRDWRLRADPEEIQNLAEAAKYYAGEYRSTKSATEEAIEKREWRGQSNLKALQADIPLHAESANKGADKLRIAAELEAMEEQESKTAHRPPAVQVHQYTVSAEPENVLEAALSQSVTGTKYETINADLQELRTVYASLPEPQQLEFQARAGESFTEANQVRDAIAAAKKLLLNAA
jgi:hypothetical protein